MSTYFSLGNPELDFASNTISHMLNEGSKLLSSLSGCTLSKEAQWPVFPDGHRASSHSPYPPKPPSFPVQSGSWPTSAQPGLHRVVPSQVLSFAMPSGSHVPLRSGPDSQSISSRHWGWSRSFSVYFHYNSTTLLMFSFSEVSACVETIHPTSMKMY